MEKYGTTPKDEERFFAMVNMSDGCWQWQGCKSAYGYGLFRLNGPKRVAHRAKRNELFTHNDLDRVAA